MQNNIQEVKKSAFPFHQQRDLRSGGFKIGEEGGNRVLYTDQQGRLLSHPISI
jgi:hypothetical protein